eukprot:3026652-Rhodomonas_salina.3
MEHSTFSIQAHRGPPLVVACATSVPDAASDFRRLIAVRATPRNQVQEYEFLCTSVPHTSTQFPWPRILRPRPVCTVLAFDFGVESSAFRGRVVPRREARKPVCLRESASCAVSCHPSSARAHALVNFQGGRTRKGVCERQASVSFQTHFQTDSGSEAALDQARAALQQEFSQNVLAGTPPSRNAWSPGSSIPTSVPDSA